MVGGTKMKFHLSCQIATDDNGITLNITLENALYFPSSLVIIINIACLGYFFKDNYDTFIKVTRYSSDFTWDLGKHTKKIQHAQSRIPEMEVTSTSSKWSIFTTVINLFTRSKKSVCNANIIEDDIDSHNLDASNSNQPDNVNIIPNIQDAASDSAASIIPEFTEDDKLVYCRDGYEEEATLQTIIRSDNSFNSLIRIPNETFITTTREFLRPTGE